MCNSSTAPWLFDDGANCFGRDGGSDCDCPAPLRPRGEVSALPAACVLSASGDCSVTASWWCVCSRAAPCLGQRSPLSRLSAARGVLRSVDTQASNVRVLVLDGSGAAAPASAVRGATHGAANGSVSVTLSGGGLTSVRVRLELDGGLLDESSAMALAA